MIVVLLSVFMADPSGIVVALESADKATVRYVENNTVVTLQADELKRLARLIETRGEPKAWDRRGALGTKDAFDIQIGDTHFGLIGWSNLMFGPADDSKVVSMVDTKFYDALRAHFVAPVVPPDAKPVVTQTLTDMSPAAIAVSEDDSLVFVADSGKGLSVYGRGHGRSGLRLSKSYDHKVLKSPSALAQYGQRVFVAGQNGIVVLEGDTQKSVTYEVVHALESTLKQPVAMAVSPDGKYLYCACLQDDRLSVYSIERNGKLILVEEFGHHEFAHPTGLVVTSTHVYVVSHDNALLTLQRDSRSGELQFADCERDVNLNGVLKPENRGLMFASGIVLEGEKLYTIGLSGTLTLWSIDESGLPQFVKRWDRTDDAFGMNGASSVVIAKGGKVWIAGKRDGAVAWFDRLNKRGMVTFGGKIDGLTSVKCLAVSHDGKTLYAGADSTLWTIAASPTAKPPAGYGEP